MTTTPDDATATADPADRCRQARELAESGEVEEAARIFEEVVDLGETPLRAQAALGLAVAKEEVGDATGAREADRVAIATGDSEYGPRAAYHLALSFERDDERESAHAAWNQIVDFGNPDYLPPAYMALAQYAEDDGDPSAARELWEHVVATGDARYVPMATVSLGIAHLDRAIEAFTGAVDSSDPEVAPLAIELLARTLPLRGRTEEAQQAWQRGLDSQDGAISSQVRSRVRRELGDVGEHGQEPLWWERFVESAVCASTLPLLADELFGALDHMYGMVAVRYAEGPRDLPADVYDLLGKVVRVPSDYEWGPALHATFRERLNEEAATDPDTQELPAGWPDEESGTVADPDGDAMR